MVRPIPAVLSTDQDGVLGVDHRVSASRIAALCVHAVDLGGDHRHG
jgi:hypothetical protein